MHRMEQKAAQRGMVRASPPQRLVLTYSTLEKSKLCKKNEKPTLIMIMFRGPPKKTLLLPWYAPSHGLSATPHQSRVSLFLKRKENSSQNLR